MCGGMCVRLGREERADIHGDDGVITYHTKPSAIWKIQASSSCSWHVKKRWWLMKGNGLVHSK